MDGFVRVPVSEQDPKVRATNFDEVCLGYTLDEAMEEASRCLKLQERPVCEGLPGVHSDSGFCAGHQGGRYREGLSGYQRVFSAPGCLRTCLPSGEPV